jgi:hypothetical protein
MTLVEEMTSFMLSPLEISCISDSPLYSQLKVTPFTMTLIILSHTSIDRVFSLGMLSIQLTCEWKMKQLDMQYARYRYKYIQI